MNDTHLSWSLFQTNPYHLLYWMEQLRSLPTISLVLILAGGILCLLYGRSVFRAIIILNAMLIASKLGWELGGQINQPFLCAAGLALILGLMAWPLFKLVIALLFGLLGVTFLAWLMNLLGISQQYWPMVAGGGFLVFALLGWFLLMPAVTLFTTVEGATLSILATLAISEQLKFPLSNLPGISFEKISLVHLSILVLAALGIFHQMGLAKTKTQNKPTSDKETQ